MDGVRERLTRIGKREVDRAEGSHGGAGSGCRRLRGHLGRRGVVVGAQGKVELLASGGSCAVNLLGHGNVSAARGHVLVVELSSVAIDVRTVVDNLGLERLGGLVAHDSDGHLDVAVVSPAVAQVGRLVNRELVRTDLVEGKLIEDRLGLRIGALDGNLVAKLLAVLVEQREGELLMRLQRSAVHSLGDLEVSRGRSGMDVVELRGIDGGAVVGDLRNEVAAVLSVVNGDRDLDVAGVEPAIAQVGSLTHGVLVGAGGVEDEFAELGGAGAGAVDGNLVTDLLVVLVEQHEGELGVLLGVLRTVDRLVDLDGGSCLLGLVGVVELGRRGRAVGVGDGGSERVVVAALAHHNGGSDIGCLGPGTSTLRELGHLVDGVGVGLAHVLVRELRHGEGGGAVLAGGDVLERGCALVGGGGGELERLAGLGGGAVDGLDQAELELAGDLLEHVVEEGGLGVLRGHGVRDGARRERAVAHVGADRDGRGHVAGHGPAHRGRRGLMNEVLVGLTGVCQAELDLAEGGAGGAHRRGDVGLGHGSAHAGCPELEIELLVGLGGLTVHGLSDGDGRRARCLVEVVELSRARVRPVIDRSDKPVGGRVHLDAHRNNHVVVSGPSIAVVANLVNHIHIRAGLVKRQLVKGRRTAGRDAHRTAELLARGLAIGIGLVERKLKGLVGLDGGRAVHGLAHRDDSLAVGNMEVVERSRAAIGNRAVVVDLRHKIARGVVNRDLDRDVDVCVVGPTHTQVSGLVDNVLVHARLVIGDGAELGSARTGHRQR